MFLNITVTSLLNVNVNSKLLSKFFSHCRHTKQPITGFRTHKLMFYNISPCSLKFSFIRTNSAFFVSVWHERKKNQKSNWVSLLNFYDRDTLKVIFWSFTSKVRHPSRTFYWFVFISWRHKCTSLKRLSWGNTEHSLFSSSIKMPSSYWIDQLIIHLWIMKVYV